MKQLVVFYSRTGATKALALSIAKTLGCDCEEIIDTKNRAGIIGYLRSGMEATLKKASEIELINKHPKDYSTIIIGTPVWALDMSSPIREYIQQNKEHFKNVAFFCTMGGSGGEKTVENMSKLAGKEPVAQLILRQSEVMRMTYANKLNEFTNKIKEIK